MASATIISTWKDSATAYIPARVAEGGVRGNVEYIGSTPLLKDDGSAKSGAELKADLVAAVKLIRDAQVAAPSTLAGVSGNVTV